MVWLLFKSFSKLHFCKRKIFKTGKLFIRKRHNSLSNPYYLFSIKKCNNMKRRIKGHILNLFILTIVIFYGSSLSSQFIFMFEKEKEHSSPQPYNKPESSYAIEWEEDGFPVCTELETQDFVKMCSDGEGGVILAWVDHRGSNVDIYAQKYNSTGHFLWGANGTTICTADESQGGVQICSDGIGGAILVWEDERDSTDDDIYAQRINSTGDVQWDNNGVPICTEIGLQINSKIISDNMGGAIITWEDRRTGDYDIYAQRIDSSGNSLWVANGTAICIETQIQWTVMMCSDDDGGAIIAWSDERVWSNFEVYAQRINSTGDVQWDTNGVPICTEPNDQYCRGICVDGTGGAFIAIEDYLHKFYVQRINSTGDLEWGGNWTPICTDSGGDYRISSDGNEGAIMVWNNANPGYNARNIYAQLVNSTGDVQWDINGKLICDAVMDQNRAEVCHDGNGGAIITWNDERDDPTDTNIYDIYYQVITKEGKSLLEANGSAVCLATDRQYNPIIISDGEGGAFLAWQDQRNVAITQTDIYMQHLNGYEISICSASQEQTNLQICSDGSGGAIITWDSNYKGINILAQRVDSNGEIMWKLDGLVLCGASGTQNFPQICSNGNGGAIITWQDYRNGEWDIFAQKVDSNGNKEWGLHGIEICIARGDQNFPLICSDNSGGAIITWLDYRSGDNWDIFAQRIDFEGNINWSSTNGEIICDTRQNQENIGICNDGNGGAIITWHDNRNINEDIFAQRVNTTGYIQWESDGVQVCSVRADQVLPQICSDGNGGAIISWIDNRDSNKDIYTQKLNSTGDPKWDENGVATCTEVNSQFNQKICSDGNGGTIVTWEDTRNGADNTDIFAQYINSTGLCKWKGDGKPICNSPKNQSKPDICMDKDFGAIITWYDNRSGVASDIYAQRIDFIGHLKWEVNGSIVSKAINDQITPKVISNENGGAIIAWEDYRHDLSGDIYARIIKNKKPTSNHPDDIITSENTTETIDWVINNVDGDGGEYQVITNDINGKFYVWIDWTPWTNNIPVDVPINYSATGLFNYTIRYYDDQNMFGIEDSVMVSIMAIPGEFFLDSDAGSPDGDGIFTLTWNVSVNAQNYSVYEFSSYISEINSSVTPLLLESTSHTLPLSGYSDGTYYFIVVANNSYGYSLSNCHKIIVTFLPQPPGSLTIGSDAGSPDDDGIFTLTWNISVNAQNYSVYEFSSYISEINYSLTSLLLESTSQTLPLSGYSDGTYYFVVVAINSLGETLSNCLEINVQILNTSNAKPSIPGYNILLLIGVLSVTAYILIRSRINRIHLK